MGNHREAKDALAVGPNAPISVVQAARADLAQPGRVMASLKEPSRPYTPVDNGRHLWQASEGGARPASSAGMQNRTAFYESGSPKMGLPKLESFGTRSDGGSRSILENSPAGGSSKLNRGSSLTNGTGGTKGTYGGGAPGNCIRSRSMDRRMADGMKDSTSQRRAGHGSTTQQYDDDDADGDDGSGFECDLSGLSVMGTGLSVGGTAMAIASSSSPSHSRDKGSAMVINGSSYSAGSSGSPGGTQQPRKTRHSDSHQRQSDRREHEGREDSRPRSHEGPSTSSYPSPPSSGGPLDPRRNDDLPARPSTSRGRPSSSSGAPGELPEGGTVGPYTGPSPNICGTSGAEVLDMSQYMQDVWSDGDEDDLGGVDASARADLLAQFGTSGPADAATVAMALANPVWDPNSPRGRSASAMQPAPLAPLAHVRQSSTPPLPPPPRPPRAGSAGAAVPAAATAGAASDASNCSPSLSAYAVGWKNRVMELLDALRAFKPDDGLGVLSTNMAALVLLVEEARNYRKPQELLDAECVMERDKEMKRVKMRDAISERVQKFTNINAELCMKAYRIVLCVSKSIETLLAASKVLYALSKENRNDTLFLREGLLQPLLHTLQVLVASAPRSKRPALVNDTMMWCCACLKNLSSHDDNQRQLVQPHGALHVARQVLDHVAKLVKEDAKPALLIAIQATGLLRNLAVLPAHAPGFVASGLMGAIREIVDVLSNDPELVLNVVRILSKLSLAEVCQESMERDGQYAVVLMKLLVAYDSNGNIIHRLTFTLGNLTTNSAAHRTAIARVPNALEHIVAIFTRYTDDAEAGSGGCSTSGRNGGSPAVSAGGTRPGSGGGTSGAGDAKLRENCLVKLLRLVANLATQRDLGEWLSSKEEVAASMMSLLSEFSFEAAEELVLNCVSALTNLSFYHTPTNKVLQIEPTELLRYVTPLLGCPNDEAKVEAARLYGNLSRSPDVCACMAKDESYVLRFLVTLLESSNAEVLHSVVGTLINFSLDAGRKQQLIDLSIVGHLIRVLEQTLEDPFGHATAVYDMALVAVVVKALFNICADDGAPGSSAHSSESSLTDDEARDLLSVLDRARVCAAGQSMEVLEVAERVSDAVLRAKPGILAG